MIFLVLPLLGLSYDGVVSVEWRTGGAMNNFVLVVVVTIVVVALMG